eukprot:TRINITY_DN94217_c0_g1_i1.p1 TRINITY_DN94217_c0_g1~~TRINITY_DN94217_c0_g1_i1.p1  ORF type:complete len:619 (+),score=94.21 TRINITY_DN94217_c0_g1_i1:144-1859(+)
MSSTSSRITVNQDFQLDTGQERYLGCSSIGTVVRAVHGPTKITRALRQISKKHVHGNELLSEVEKLQSIDHPHICKLYNTWEDSMSVYMVMDLCSGGSLTSLSAQSELFSETRVSVLILQMLQAVAHLHAAGLVHSDIRPENWLFQEPVGTSDNMCIKMIDFGLANKHGCAGALKPPFRTSSFSSFSSNASFNRGCVIATASASHCRAALIREDMSLQERSRLLCQAPEQIDQRTTPSQSMDIWALGVLAYFLLSGNSPFEGVAGSSRTEETSSFKNARYVFMPADVWRPVSSNAKHFIALCLQLESSFRPSAERLLDLPWMQAAQLAKDRAERSSLPESASEKPGKADSGNGNLNGELVETASSARLDVLGPPLPTAHSIVSSLESIERMQVAERLAIIAIAHKVHSQYFPSLLERLALSDTAGKGVLPFVAILRGLESYGFPCRELESIARSSIGPVAYNNFLNNVTVFQQNMQDSAVWFVFRSFDSASQGKVDREVLARKLRQPGEETDYILTSFPELSLDKFLSALRTDSKTEIGAEELQALLDRVAIDQVVASTQAQAGLLVRQNS